MCGDLTENSVARKIRLGSLVKAQSEYASLASTERKGVVMPPFAILGSIRAIEFDVPPGTNWDPMDCACES